MQQDTCQEEYMPQAKCYHYNKPSVTTHEEYMQQPSVIHAIN